MTPLQIKLLLVAQILCGLSSGLLYKQQQRSVVNGVEFNHPFMQTYLMFMGEALCYVLFLVYKKVYPQQYKKECEDAVQEGLKLNPSKFLFAIPTLCDFTTTTVGFFAMYMMPLSINYMINGGNLIVISVFSVIFLKKVLYRHHYMGLFFNILGLIVIGVSALQNASDGDNSSLLLGIILQCCTFFTGSTQSIVEEKFFRNYHLNPFEFVGYEGFWGLLITMAGLNIFTHVDCPSMIQDCPDGKMESVPGFFDQVFTIEGEYQPTLLIVVILTIFAIFFLNGIALSITKYLSALTRSVVASVVPFAIWMATLALGWEEFNYIQLIGYIIITFGSLIYNEIINIPIFNMNYYTKEKIAQREKMYQEKPAITIDLPNCEEDAKINDPQLNNVISAETQQAAS
ncbi:hypothetical protein ABPG74_011794 [Tetrahymena malaccensis]